MKKHFAHASHNRAHAYDRFQDREQAGLELADYLETHAQRLQLQSAVVIALPRGGVSVAYPIARRLKAPLDVLAVKKIGAPGFPEYGVGAVTEGSSYYINFDAALDVGLSGKILESLIDRKLEEAEAKAALYRNGRELIDVAERTVILVDDGLATGVTMHAAARAMLFQGAKRIIIAVPVCSKSAKESLDQFASVISLRVPESFDAVGNWYEDFAQLSDEDVQETLAAMEEPAGEEHIEGTIGESTDVSIPIGGSGLLDLKGVLHIPSDAKGLVIFAHGSGSSRKSARNLAVARELNQSGMATLLFDLLTHDEASEKSLEDSRVFDIPELARRLVAVTRWLHAQPRLDGLPIGYFGASTGAGAALWAAAELPGLVSTVVSRGGRPDLALSRLSELKIPVLLIVGSQDRFVEELNREALGKLSNGSLKLIPGATHLFEEPGALEAVSACATEWFDFTFRQQGGFEDRAA